MAPVLQWPAIRRRVQFKPRDPNNQIRAKRFPGGWVQVKGANSPKEFRRVTADKVLLEEPDGYPPAAGREGDQASLAFKRCLTSDEPLKAAGSTPTIHNASKIDSLFQTGTQEHRYLPCPHCGLMQRLVWGDGTGAGMRWEPRERPTRAWYVCEAGCEIEEHHKAAMDAAGEWRAHAPQNWPHRSFHIWSAYSQFPGAAWVELAREFMDVRKDPNRLMTFVNQTLGETWRVKGEAPAWRRLYDRREEREPYVVPRGGLVLTAGIDVQKNRVEIFIWAWGADRQSWLVDHEVIEGNPFLAEVWARATDYVQRTWPHRDGTEMKVARVGVDTGFATTQVESWARKHPGLVIPLKGASNLTAPVFAWSDVREAGAKGGKRKRGQRLGLVGGHLITLELYGFLSLDRPTTAEATEGRIDPAGYVHIPTFVGEEFCRQMVGDQWVEATASWKQVHATEALDGWKYARTVCVPLGLDRFKASDWRTLARSLGVEERPARPQAAAQVMPVPTPQAPAPPPQKRVIRSSFVGRVRR